MLLLLSTFVFKMRSCFGCCAFNQLHFFQLIIGDNLDRVLSELVPDFVSRTNRVTFRLGTRRQQVHNILTK